MFKQSVKYLIGSSVAKSVPFFMVPILTFYLTPEQIGLASLYQVLTALFLPIVGFNLHVNVSKVYHFGTKDELQDYINWIMISVFVWASFLCIILGIFYPNYLNTYIKLPNHWAIGLPIVVAFFMAYQVKLALLRTEEKANQYIVWEIGASIVNLAVTLILVIIFFWGWEGRGTGIVSTYVLFGSLSLFVLVRPSSLDKNNFIKMFKVSLPILPHAISMLVVTSSDKLFLNSYEGSSSLGIYFVAFQFGMVVTVIADSLAKAWTPYLFRSLKEKKYKDIKNKIVIVVFFMFAFSLLYTAFLHFLFPLIVQREYLGGIRLLPFFVFGYFAFSIFQFFFGFFINDNKTGLIGKISSLVMFISIGLNFYLIPTFGVYGAAMVFLISMFIHAALILRTVYKLESFRRVFNA